MFRKQLILKYLEYGFDKSEAIAEIDLAYDLVSGLRAKDVLLGNEPSLAEKNRIQSIVDERIVSKKPIQHLLGESYFMGDLFFVNKHTLIPRPETELLVVETLKKIDLNTDKIRVLEIGSGTGCISVEIAKYARNADIVSVDISDKALKVARENAMRHCVGNRIVFVLSDLFENVHGEFDIIVSNPPYIPLAEKAALQVEVKDYEPHSALFADDDLGLSFYEKITLESANFLKNRGCLLFELGINQSKSVECIMKENGFCNIMLSKDFEGIGRVISGEKYSH